LAMPSRWRRVLSGRHRVVHQRPARREFRSSAPHPISALLDHAVLLAYRAAGTGGDKPLIEQAARRGDRRQAVRLTADRRDPGSWSEPPAGQRAVGLQDGEKRVTRSYGFTFNTFYVFSRVRLPLSSKSDSLIRTPPCSAPGQRPAAGQSDADAKRRHLISRTRNGATYSG
jgi:hypothetical protein